MSFFENCCKFEILIENLKCLKVCYIQKYHFNVKAYSLSFYSKIRQLPGFPQRQFFSVNIVNKLTSCLLLYHSRRFSPLVSSYLTLKTIDNNCFPVKTIMPLMFQV